MLTCRRDVRWESSLALTLFYKRNYKRTHNVMSVVFLVFSLLSSISVSVCDSLSTASNHPAHLKPVHSSSCAVYLPQLLVLILPTSLCLSVCVSVLLSAVYVLSLNPRLTFCNPSLFVFIGSLPGSSPARPSAQLSNTFLLSLQLPTFLQQPAITLSFTLMCQY